MSAFVNAANEYLDATVSAGPLETEWKLVAAWVKRPSSEALGSQNVAFHLNDTGGTFSASSVYVAGSTNSTPSWQGRGGNANGTPVTGAVTFTSDAWMIVGTLLAPNTGSGSAVLKTYADGVTNSSSAVNSTSSARQLTHLRLGANLGDVSARWRGYIAEAAVFIPASEANADAIMAELATTTADAIASGTPVWYATLLSDGVATVGSDATVNGTTTFDADHPTLSNGANITDLVADSLALSGALTLAGDIESVIKKWRVPTTATASTAVHVTILTGTSPTYSIEAQGAATVDASGNADISGTGTIGDKALAFVHNYDDDDATTSINGGAGIATLVDAG